MEINQEHPEYRRLMQQLPAYRDLYAGGAQFLGNVTQYLSPRKYEPADIYRERARDAYYENYIGSIIDWYAATLFRREPVLTYSGKDERARKYFNAFAEDCDLRGSTLSDFFRRQLVETLVAGRSYIVVDFPRTGERPSTRAEEEVMGLSRAYLCEYPAQCLVNWQRDAKGEYEWVVLRSERLLTASADKQEATAERRWLHYDRERFSVWVQEQRGDRKSTPQIVDEGMHGLARLGRVPLFEFSLGEGLWMMNKAASLQVEHFNKSNALSWSLKQGLFAMPVIFTDAGEVKAADEHSYLHLGQGDRFEFAEPKGTVHDVALRNIDRLKEEIYRVSYVLSQAGGSMSKNTALTGYSKQRDYTITQEVLRGFGDTVKDTMKRVLDAIAAAREDELQVGVSGLDEFDIGEFSSELADAQSLLALGIESPTLKAEIQKRLAMKYLCDARQEVKERIAREIEGAVAETK